LYESNGLYGKSNLRTVDLESGKVIKSVPIDERYFAEGASGMGGLIYQLTWREGVCFVYDAKTFALKYQLHYAGEGWGLTNDGRQLIISDGSDVIRFLSPQTLREERRIKVHKTSGSVRYLNELELIEGELWANVYTTNQIVRIDTATGNVLGIIDLTGILPSVLHTRNTDVLNGIAYDAERKRIFVTGKNWGRLFEIEVKEKK
jgi:glutamine cyclotransferase